MPHRVLLRTDKESLGKAQSSSCCDRLIFRRRLCSKWEGCDLSDNEPFGGGGWGGEEGMEDREEEERDRIFRLPYDILLEAVTE